MKMITVKSEFHKYMLIRIVQLKGELYQSETERAFKFLDFYGALAKLAEGTCMAMNLAAKIRGIREIHIGGSFPESVLIEKS